MKKQAFNVLVVEDSPRDNEKYCEWVSGKGYVAHPACSVKQALDVLATRGREIDIALVDIRLERELGGLEVIAEIHKGYSWISCVVVTAFPDLGHVSECMMAGVCGYIIKGETPLDLELAVLQEAGFRRASIGTFEDLRRCVDVLKKEINATKRDMGLLEERLKAREEEIESLYNRLCGLAGGAVGNPSAVIV